MNLMSLLSAQSCKRVDVYFKFVGPFAAYRQMSYLSFYINQKGDKMKYDPYLSFSQKYNDPKSNTKFSLEQYMSTVNQTYLYNQCLLTGFFNNQILTLQQTRQMLRNCLHLSFLSKKDIVNYMFGTRLQYDVRDWVDHFKKGELDVYNMKFQSKEGILPDERRKNYFIVVDEAIHNFQQLQELILQKNQFLHIPNVNKILCLDMQVENITKFNNELFRIENFFKQKNIKIKNLSTQKIPKNFESKPLSLGYRIHKLLEYVAKNIKGNTLLHQLPEYYQFYTEAEKPQSGITNLQRFQPKQTLIYTQRMGDFNYIQDNSDFGFDDLAKSFTYRFEKDPYYSEFSKGLLISRYLSKYGKKKNAIIIKMQEKGTMYDPKDDEDK